MSPSGGRRDPWPGTGAARRAIIVVSAATTCMRREVFMASSDTPVQRPFQASIQARLSRGGIDTVEEIDYDGGQFTRRFRVLPGPGAITVLNDDQLRQLLADLRAELRAAPAGVDLLGLEVFADLIEDA